MLLYHIFQTFFIYFQAEIMQILVFNKIKFICILTHLLHSI